MKNYLKKFIVGLLVMALTVTGIDYVPARADDESNYYVGFTNNLKEDNIMTNEDGVYTYSYGEVVKGDTLSFGVYFSTSWNSVACAWNDYDAYSDGYAKICFDGEKVVLKIYEDAEYTSYIEDTTVPVTYDYYIGFSKLFGMEKEDDSYVYAYGEYTADSNIGFGIYNSKEWEDVKVAWANYTVSKSGYAKIFFDAETSTVEVKVFTDNTYTTEVSDDVVETVYYTKNGDEYTIFEAIDGAYTYKYGAVATGDTVEFSVYTLADEEYTAAATNSTTFENDGYALYTFDADKNEISIELYTDDTYTEKVSSGETEEGFTLYVNYTDGSALYLLVKDAIADVENAGTLWGRTAYEMSDASEEVGEEGWFKLVIPSKESLPVFQFVTELSDDGWLSNFGIDNNEEGYNAIKAVTGNVAYFNAKGETCVGETLAEYKEATGNVEVKYYIGGKPTYFNGDVALTGNDWNVMNMDLEEDGAYTYKLGELEEGTAVENAIYSDLAWSEAYAWNTITVQATGFVKLIFDPAAGTLIQKVYTDNTYTEEVSFEDTMATIYVYYPGNKDVTDDTLTICFSNSAIAASSNASVLGEKYAQTYWGRNSYPMTKYADNWYKADVYKSFGGFQIVANPHSEVYPDNTSDDENTSWLIDFGDYGDVSTGDVNSERYNKLFADGVAYVMYNTLFESIDAANAYDAAYSWDYYISGSTSDFEDDINAGIFSNYWSQDDYKWVEEENKYAGKENWLDLMDKNGTTLTWKSSVKAEKFKSYTMNIYADKSWFGKVGNNFAFLSVADAYVQITYDLKTKVYKISYFTDAECTESYEFDPIDIYYYYGSDDASNLTIVFNATLEGKKVVNTYWGRNAYAMTSVGNGWYVFKGYTADLGGFQIVNDPHGEDYSKGETADNDDTTWYLDIGDYGDVSTADSDLSKFFDVLAAGNKAYIKYNKIFKTQSAAESFTDWTYYVAGSTNAFTNTASGKGIFSNYWAGDFEEGVDPETGESYTKKVDTWPDVLTKEKEDVYSVVLGKAVKGTTYEFNIYTEKDWNAMNLSGKMGKKNPSFEATSNNYVKLYFYRDLKTGNNTWAIKYYTDKECKNQAKLATPKKLKVVNLKPTKGAKVKLAWKAVDGASSYVIYANGKKVATSKTNSKVLKYKKQGKTIKYTVVARGSEYGTSDVSAVLKVKTPKKVAKKGLKAKNQKKGILVKWKKVKASNGYVIYRSTKKNKGYKKLTVIKKAKTVKFLDKKAKSGKKYFYKIYAFRKNGKKKVYSAASKVVSAKKK